MSFPRYPTYKDSGQDWIGALPMHWGILPVKRLFGVVGGSTPASDTTAFWDGDVPWVTPADLSKLGQLEISESQRSITDAGVASCSTTVSPAGSIILSTRAPIGSLAISTRPMCTNQGCKTLVPIDHAFARYFGYLFGIATEPLNLRGKGTTFLELSGDELGRFHVPAPPLEEQRDIAAFLDRETAKIDALVAEQRRLMDLLSEQRQAVISHAVTKGLSPNAPMKDSGVEWLGEIPAHWSVAALARIASRVVVGIAEAATHAYTTEGVPILRSTNVRANRIVGELLHILPDFARERGSKLLAAGDLVTVRTGNAGVTAVVPPELDGCQCFTMLVTSLREGFVGEYVCHWLNSAPAQAYFSLEGWGTAQVNISVPILKAVPVPLPPIQEQRAVLTYLNGKLLQTDALVQEVEHSMDLLAARRAALITAAVTGQIDVRGLALSEAA